jgi:hypothetical protein
VAEEKGMIARFSPGGAVRGVEFLGKAISMVRGMYSAADWMNATQFTTLFLLGVCLRDAEQALPPANLDAEGMTFQVEVS